MEMQKILTERSRIISAKHMPKLIEDFKAIEHEKADLMKSGKLSFDEFRKLDKRTAKKEWKVFKGYAVKSPEYWRRIKTGAKYGIVCGTIAGGILSDIPPLVCIGFSAGITISLCSMLKRIRNEYETIRNDISSSTH